MRDRGLQRAAGRRQPARTSSRSTSPSNFPTYIAADFAPLEARIIDEDTYVEQGRDLEKRVQRRRPRLHPRRRSSRTPSSRSSATRSPTSSATSSWALYTPTDIDGDPNPYYDDLEGNGTPDGRVAIREGYIRSAYHEADAKLGARRARSWARTRPRSSPGPTTASRRSGTPSTPRKVLPDAGLSERRNSSRTAARLPRPVDGLTAKACWPVDTAPRPAGPAGRGADLRQLPAPRLPAHGPRPAGLRGRPEPDHRRVPEPDRPGQPGQAGRPARS